MCHPPQTPRRELDPEEGRLIGLAADAGEPQRAAILHALGCRLAGRGAHTAAITIYRQLCLTRPDDASAHACLASLLYDAGAADAAHHHYQAALRASPGCREAHQGLGNLCAARGQTAQAWAHWRAGYTDRVFNVWAYRGAHAPIRVLLPISVRGGNVRARALFDDTIHAVTAVHMEFFTPDHALPPHDLIFNAIGDADLCAVALRAAAALAARSAAPVINPPEAVARTGRCGNARRLARIPGVVCPAMVSLPRAGLDAQALERLGWPVLLRAPGYHTGQHFLRVETPGALASAAATLPGPDVLAMQCLEARKPDGHWRKGRVMIIGGTLYPLHWAVSDTWKVHYFTAGMAAHAAHRAEEARFLNDMAGFLGARAVAALGEIGRVLGLDYAGVDFALGADGALLLFEANAAMVILAPPEGAMWDYRRRAAAAALAAARGLVDLGGPSRSPQTPRRNLASPL